MAKLISVCMASHNRKRQLINTLWSIEHTRGKIPIEVIIVDDNSEELLSRDELRQFRFRIVYKVRKDRIREDPVIPNNIAFSMATGDIILMACAEVLLAGNILEHAFQNTNESNYLCYSVYSFGTDQFHHINGYNWADKFIIGRIQEIVSILSQTHFIAGEAPGWYIHPVHRPTPLPFCASLTRSNMEKLSGYDERFKFGVGHADDDFVRRVGDLGLQKVVVAQPLAVHQPHQYTDYTNTELVQLNYNLYIELEKTHNTKASENLIYRR